MWWWPFSHNLMLRIACNWWILKLSMHCWGDRWWWGSPVYNPSVCRASPGDIWRPPGWWANVPECLGCFLQNAASYVIDCYVYDMNAFKRSTTKKNFYTTSNCSTSLRKADPKWATMSVGVLQFQFYTNLCTSCHALISAEPPSQNPVSFASLCKQIIKVSSIASWEQLTHDCSWGLNRIMDWSGPMAPDNNQAPCCRILRKHTLKVGKQKGPIRINKHMVGICINSWAHHINTVPSSCTTTKLSFSIQARHI